MEEEKQTIFALRICVCTHLPQFVMHNRTKVNEVHLAEMRITMHILENLNPEDKKMLPQKVIEFFKENKSETYIVNLTTEKTLLEQHLKDETKAFLQIINYKYFADKNQKEEFLKIFKENKNTDIFFKNEIEVEEVCIDEKNEITELTIYKENKIIAFLKKILNFFRK